MDQKTMMQALAPKDDDAFARRFIEAVRTGNYDAARQQLNDSLQGEKADKGLQAVHDLLAKGDVLETEMIGCNVASSGDKRRSDLSYQLHFHDFWAAGDVVVDTQNGSESVVGFHFNQIRDSFEAMNRFTFVGKSMAHYVVLASCIVIPLFIAYSLVLCVRTPIRRKWLWVIFIIVGFSQLNFNWSTGAWNIKPISIVLGGSGFHAAGPYAPWIFDFSLPIGAIVFLIKRRSLLKTPATPPEVPTITS